MTSAANTIVHAVTMRRDARVGISSMSSTSSRNRTSVSSGGVSFVTVSLIAKRLDGSERSRSVRGIDAEEQSDHHRHTEGEDDRVELYDRRDADDAEVAARDADEH